jgi:hypothetical protein
LAGDVTVPIVGTCRADVQMDSNTLRRVPDKHGNLQCNAALDEVEGILTASSTAVKAIRRVALRVNAPDLALAGQPITIHGAPSPRHAIRLAVTSETGALVKPAGSGHPAARHHRRAHARRVHHRRTGADPASPFAPVSSDTVIWKSPKTEPSVR